MSPKMQVAISFIEDNLHRAVPVEEIARLVKLSRSRLCSLIKAEVGLAPTQYLRKLRMEKALELLQTSFLEIKEIAAKVGYNDSTTLCVNSRELTARHPPSIERAIVATDWAKMSSGRERRIG